MIFNNPLVLVLIPVAILAGYFIKKKKTQAAVRFSCGQLVKAVAATWKLAVADNMIYLRVAAIVFLLIALARPQKPLEEANVQAEGIDIVLAVDCSGSMLAEDFTIGTKRYNRLAVVKNVVKDFISNRKNDRIGMVAFAARAYTVCPLTLDYDWLIENLDRVEIGTIEDGTAVGSAIASSVNRIKETNAKSRMVILLTDGINNAGSIAPLAAAEAAKTLGIKIYTIGAGSKGAVPFPARDFFGRKVYQNVVIELDEATLKKIAQATGGKYFRATDTQSLRDIYKEIDAMEKTPVQEKGFQEFQELCTYFLIAGFLLLVAEIIVSHTLARELP